MNDNLKKDDNSKRTIKVLLVDDDLSALRLLMQGVFRPLNLKGDYNYDVVSCNSAAAAKEELKLNKPNIIITDYMMPIEDGLSLCKYIRSQKELDRCYLIMSTCFEEDKLLAQAFEIGVDDFVLKGPQMIFNLTSRLKAAVRIVLAQEETIEANSKLQELINVDSLTSLHNRRAVMRDLQQIWNNTRKGNGTFSCLMIDVDHFKKVNDTYGHQKGDEILMSIASTLKYSLRGNDEVYRYGGEEFIAICYNTNKQGALSIAERLNAAVRNQVFVSGDIKFFVTISIGVVEYSATDTKIEQMICRADEALYKAKELGRNRVEIA